MLLCSITYVRRYNTKYPGRTAVPGTRLTSTRVRVLVSTLVYTLALHSLLIYRRWQDGVVVWSVSHLTRVMWVQILALALKSFDLKYLPPYCVGFCGPNHHNLSDCYSILFLVASVDCATICRYVIDTKNSLVKFEH